MKEIKFKICDLVETCEQGFYPEQGFYTCKYNYHTELEYFYTDTINLSDKVKFPSDFDREKDLPFNISRRIFDYMCNDEHFILEVSKAYKDYLNKDYINGVKWNNSYKTSCGEIILCTPFDDVPSNTLYKIICCLTEKDLKPIFRREIDINGDIISENW